ncbi:hypothetical protein EB796_003822 [Bugula neritina]|uniref:D-isomer specific 2-hydroxyacid dehydrogenase NAD-binding domain-containing protein n=1 Tax=Bugula neritina TaxID=10212 RepID=A0A7J7KHW9_BUGNE|nr:hypothetical protein EB796_003822 [Bugula neritina]
MLMNTGLLDNEKLKVCSSKRSVFINVGRGDICTEDSILQALREKWIGAAILDVLPTEPLPLDSLLWKHPQVTITPHVAAGPLIPKTVEFIAKNLQNYIHDKPLEYVIDWSKSY